MHARSSKTLRKDSKSIINIIYSAECFKLNQAAKVPMKTKCSKCGMMSSNKICKSCTLLEQLDKVKERPLK